MKILTFPDYSREEKDDVGRPPVQARAWFIAFLAVSQAPSGPTAERSAYVSRLYNAFKGLMLTEKQADGAPERYLNPAGGSFVLEEAEIKVLKEIIDDFRKQVTGAGADALVFLDQLIANAPEQAKAVN